MRRRKRCGTYSKRGKFRGDPQNLCGKFRGQSETRNLPHKINLPRTPPPLCFVLSEHIGFAFTHFHGLSLPLPQRFLSPQRYLSAPPPSPSKGHMWTSLPHWMLAPNPHISAWANKGRILALCAHCARTARYF